MNNMGLVEIDDGNLGRAQHLIEEALAIKRELGEPRSIAIGLVNLADILIKRSQWDAAEEVLAETVGFIPGNPQLAALIRINQGLLATHRQDFAGATEHFRAAMATAKAGGHPYDVIDTMIGLARVHDRTGDRDEAIRQLRAARALAAEIGSERQQAAADAALTDVTAAGPHVRPGSAGSSPVIRALPAGLTRRQADVLQLLAAGLSNRQIAAELCLSAATVERHLATVYRNLGLAGRVEAARFALDSGLADTERHRPSV
jgi:DNA-binding NarL/FixJ family response regulator